MTTPPYGSVPFPGQEMSPSDQMLWSTLSHLSGFVSALGPLVAYLIFKDRGAFVSDQAKEALNFQITVLLAYVVGGITAILIVGIFILMAAGVLSVVFMIIAAVQANKGIWYRYPINIRFIR